MKVSVLMITYNHEKYIRQALDSVVKQDVNFEYEVVIGEDCSTDNTRNILLEYREKYPDTMRLLLPENNVGMMPNFIATLSACTGEYIALLEGDDFWISENKLQKQADFLDAHSDCSICFNPTRVFYEDGGNPAYISPSQTKPFYSIYDLLHDNFMHTCSVMCRNKIRSFPEWFRTSLVGDYPFHLLNAEYGNVGCIEDVMSAYRIHDSGVWSMQHEKHLVRNAKARIELYRNINDHYQGMYKNLIRRRIFSMEFMIFKHIQKQSHFRSLPHLLKLIFLYPSQLLMQKFSRCKIGSSK